MHGFGPADQWSFVLHKCIPYMHTHTSICIDSVGGLSGRWTQSTLGSMNRVCQLTREAPREAHNGAHE